MENKDKIDEVFDKADKIVARSKKLILAIITAIGVAIGTIYTTLSVLEGEEPLDEEYDDYTEPNDGTDVIIDSIYYYEEQTQQKAF